MAKVFLYKVDDNQNLIHGKKRSIPDGATSVDGYYFGADLDHNKSWMLDANGNAVERPIESGSSLSVELARLDAGRIATAEFAVAMKGDGGVLNSRSSITADHFRQLNDAGEPVSWALAKGQFGTALERWREIFSANTTVSQRALIVLFIKTDQFAALDLAVESIIKAKMKEWDGLTDAQLAAL